MIRTELSPAGSLVADNNTGSSLGEKGRHEKNLLILPGMHAGDNGSGGIALILERLLILHNPQCESPRLL